MEEGPQTLGSIVEEGPTADTLTIGRTEIAPEDALVTAVADEDQEVTKWKGKEPVYKDPETRKPGN